MQTDATANENIGISLVGGDPAIRHGRQIMLRSKRYDVRSYATYGALLADARSRAHRCIVVDVDLLKADSADLLREMRATGWTGKGILLGSIPSAATVVREAERHGDTVLARDVADGPLLTAIIALVQAPEQSCI